MDPDLTLLRQYTTRADQGAFERVVHRHVDLVYAAAMRQMRDPHMADEVTQAVFVLLAKKARRLPDNLLIGGWLVNATRLICKSHRRSQRRRTTYEQRAAAMRYQSQTQSENEQAHREQLSDLIDDALSRLDRQSRGMIVMQFMQGQNGKEIALALGISELAVRKRISRAITKLRRIFAKNGVSLSSNGVGAAIVGMKMCAPPGLAALSSTAALSAGANATVAGVVLGKWSAFLLGLQAKALATCILASVMVVGLGVTVVAMQQGGAPTTPPPQNAPAIAPAPIAAADPAGAILSGVVIDSTGKPVSGAEVLVGVPDKQIFPYDTRTKLRDGIDTTTDSAGKFSIKRPDGSFALVFRSPSGFAEVLGSEFRDQSNITLAPWARIEGTATEAGKPMARAQIQIWRIPAAADPLRNLVNHQTVVKADALGRYVIPRVVPGELWICPMAYGPGVRHQYRYVQVEPGQTLKFDWGAAGQGYEVLGHVDVPAAAAAIVKWTFTGEFTYSATLRLQSDRGTAVHAPSETAAQYRAVEEAYGRTDAGKLAKDWLFGRDFAIRPDGTFQIDSLPPGKFELNVRNLQDLPEVNFMEDVAGLTKDFEIPSTQPATSPIDLGAMTLEARHLLRPGDKAPDFTARAIDGSQWRLADHLGKPVVLVMWGAYNNGWQDEMKALGDFAQAWTNDPRISILGIYQANNAIEAAEYRAKYHLDFQQTDDSELMSLYDNSWPSAVLVGADGKIIQKHLNAKKLAEYLEKTVGPAGI